MLQWGWRQQRAAGRDPKSKTQSSSAVRELQWSDSCSKHPVHWGHRGLWSCEALECDTGASFLLLQLTTLARAVDVMWCGPGAQANCMSTFQPALTWGKEAPLFRAISWVLADPGQHHCPDVLVMFFVCFFSHCIHGAMGTFPVFLNLLHLLSSYTPHGKQYGGLQRSQTLCGWVPAAGLEVASKGYQGPLSWLHAVAQLTAAIIGGPGAAPELNLPHLHAICSVNASCFSSL